jgi:AcrR family transcriptional regulator
MAMIDAVGEYGYAKTRVADITARARVSRKAFYEHFANKQECFLTSYDTIATEGLERVTSAYREAEDISDSARLAIGALFTWAIENPRALRLMLVEVNAAGPAGIERRERLIAAFEQLLREGLRVQPGPGTVPNPVLRAVIGGVNNVLYTYVQGGRQAELVGLIPDLVRWAASYPPPATVRLNRLLSRVPTPAHMAGGRAPGTLSPHSRTTNRRGLMKGEHNVSPSYVIHSQRERILDAVANITAERGYAGVTSQGIADEAAISLEAVYRHFSDKEDAFLVAYEIGHGRAVGIVERAHNAESDWRNAVRAGVFALFDFLASEPAFAHMALVDALVATPRTADRAKKGIVPFAKMLVPGLRQVPTGARPPTVTIEVIAGGVYELCLRHALQRRIEELPKMAPWATYFALAPFTGAEEAVDVAVEGVPPR